MCGICGCSETHEHDHDQGEHAHDHGHDHAADHHHDHDAGRVIRLEKAVFEKNDRLAAENRGYFRGREIYALNLLSGPGAGKTALLERLARDHGARLALTVVEADLATDRDAERIRAAGAPVVQVNTGVVCHLDAHMLGHALEELAPAPASTLIIENVGNLVCPAMFDLGEADRLVVWSVTEGEDKPIKYPHMFARATAIVLSKIDLAPHVPFDEPAALEFVRRVCPRVPIFRTSARTGEGFEELADWIEARGKSARGRPAVKPGAATT